MAGGIGLTNFALDYRNRGIDSPYHHGTHRQLLQNAHWLARYPADLDAIIVPTARKAAILRPVMDLAAKLKCPLLLLCSRWSRLPEVDEVARGREAEIIAIDANSVAGTLVPTLGTNQLLATVERGLFERRTDTSLKRNLGRLLAQLAGWRRIAFLDDDITVESDDLRQAAGLTDTYAGVGLFVDGHAGDDDFPDNSVVCHAFRLAGGNQDTFIGGGALVLRVSEKASYFPNIYNEDWFFLLAEDDLQEVTATGHAKQHPFDPFRDGRRARSEELGDCLAEGIYSLLDDGGSIDDADERFWAGFLARRQKFIAQVIELVNRNIADPAKRARMVTALKAAEGRRTRITPELCAEFVRRWQSDRELWRRHINRLYADQGDRPIKDPAALLASLGLTKSWYRRRS